MSGYIGNIPVPQATQTRDNFTATSGQTTFSTSGYTPSYLDVYLNGVHLDPSDYTATNGTDVVLGTGATAGDVLEVVAFTTFTPANLQSDKLVDSGGTTRVQTGTSGDVEFYEDTGTTAKFFWDASAESLGIGTTSPTELIDLEGSSGARIAFTDTGTRRWSIGNDGTSLTFVDVSASGERMRIDSSGNLLVGTTSASGLSTAGHRFIQGTGGYVEHVRTSTSDASSNIYLSRANNGNAILFYRNDVPSIVGTISVTTTSTSYNTSSDYRLKTDVQPMTGATERLKALKPVNFEWIESGERVDGFLAHEAQEVVPEAVTGTKDAMRTEEYEVTPAEYEDVVIPAVLDDEGNEIEPERTEQRLVTEAVMGTREVPDYQGIDQSKIVPLLVASLQEALTEIDSLKARIEVLEGASA